MYMDSKDFASQLKEFLTEWNNPSDYITVCTSGSTGRPKEIRLDKNFMRASARRSNTHFNITSKSRLHLCLPVSHIAGKMMVVRALEAGCRLTAEPPSSTPSFKGCGRHLTLVAIVGSQIKGLYDLSLKRELPNITHVLIGGSPLTQEQHSMALELGKSVWESYGMTETSSHIALRRLMYHNISIPTPFNTLPKIKVHCNDLGCLVVDMPEAPQIVTNDIATIISKREFLIHGRYDNVLISGGLKVHPETVEHIIGPLFIDMGDFYVTSRPHPKWGEEIVVVVEAPDRLPTGVTQAEIAFTDRAGHDMMAWMRDLLQRHEVPHAVIAVRKLERTSNGKIIRKKLT